MNYRANCIYPENQTENQKKREFDLNFQSKHSHTSASTTDEIRCNNYTLSSRKRPTKMHASSHPQLNLNFILASKRQRHVNVGRGELKRVYKLFSANDTKVKLIGQSEMRRKGRTHSKQNKKTLFTKHQQPRKTHKIIRKIRVIN